MAIPLKLATVATVAFVFASLTPALSQGPQPKNVLTASRIEHFIAAFKKIDAMLSSRSKSGGERVTDIVPALIAIARANGFASVEDFDATAAAITIILSATDPATRKYEAPDAVIRREIAEVKAHPLNDGSDKQSLNELEEALRTSKLLPAPSPGDIALVLQHFDRLDALFR